ncbi:MAG: leucine-rich repeat domain-containing protein, partial [Tenericutes bacterium]|nr:leucine-rich repeat domain-containing protein [Mycoplasmatota bacterium]
SITGHKPEHGQLIIAQDGKTALAFHNGKYCARKSFNSNEITISKISVDECTLNISPSLATNDNCFDFDSSTGTIIEYYDYQNDNSSNPICPTDVVIPSKINGVTVREIGSWAFAYYNYATYNENNNNDTVLLSNSTEKYTVSNLSTKNTKNIKNINTGSNKAIALRHEKITSVVIPDTVEIIGDSSFIVNEITSLVIPNSVTYIGAGAFERNDIVNLILGDGLQTIEYAAFQRNAIENLTIPNNVTYIGENAFEYNNLRFIKIGSGVNTIVKNPFKFSENIVEIVVNTSNLNYMSSNNAVYTKDGKTLLFGGKTGSNNILSSTITIEEGAFTGTEITTVTIPNGVVTIKSGAFSNNSLTTLIIPNSVVVIEDYAFLYNNLNSVTIGTGITTIGENAFYHNKIPQGSLTIDRASGSVSIGSDAFRYNGSNGNTTITPKYLR